MRGEDLRRAARQRRRSRRWIVAPVLGGAAIWMGFSPNPSQLIAQEAPAAESKPAEGAPAPGSVPPGATAPGGAPANGTPPANGGATPPGATPGANPATAPAAPAAVTRASKPAERTNDEAFKVRPDADGMVQFQFEGAPWPALIDWLSDVTGMAIDWQELPGDFINLKTQQKYSIAETRDLINRHLLARGYTLLQDGELMVVVKTAGINTGIVPRVDPAELAKRMPHDFVKVSFELEWLLAEEVATELKPMISSNGQLLALKTTNRLEAIDVARNLQQVYEVLRAEQSAESHERQMRDFKLEYVRAAYVKEKLEQLLGIASKQSQMPMSPEQQQQMMMMQQQMQQQMQQGGQPSPPGRKETEVKIVVNEQRNSVLVMSSPDKMVAISEAIRLLDVRDDRAGSLDQVIGSIRTYRLATLNPKDVVDVLMETGALDPETRLKTDEKSSAIIVTGPPWDHMTVEKLIKKLDGSPRNFKVVRLRRRRADQVATTVDSLMVGPQEDTKKNQRRSWYYDDWFGNRNQDDDKSKDRFRVAADVEHNWLMLWCNEQEHERVLELLGQLGEIPDRSGNGSQVRVIDAIPAERVDELLERVQKAFGPLAPNPVVLPPPVVVPEAKPEAADKPGTDEARRQTPAEEPKKSDNAAVSATLGALADTDVEQQFVSERRTTEVADVAVADVAAVDGVDSSTRLVGEDAKEEGNAKVSAAIDTDINSGANAKIEPEPAPAWESRAGRATPADSDNSAELRSTDQPADRPPIHVTRTPDGRIVIHSADPAALDIFEELIDEFRPENKDYTVFHLKYATASWVRLQLLDFFEEEEKDEDDSDSWRRFFYFGESEEKEKKTPLGLSERRPIRFISDLDTNTIVVRNATTDQLATVEELINLYDVPEPQNKEKARHTKLVYVKHSKASKVAEQIKDAFRDLLSGNDKAFQQQPQQGGGEQPPQRSSGGGGMSSGLAFGEGDKKTQSDTQASFKGKLSIGVDDDTNTILLSTDGEKLMQIIVAMITELDKAAKPADDVRVVQLKGGVGAARPVQDAIRKTLRIQGDANAPAQSKKEGEAEQADGNSSAAPNRGQRQGGGNGNGNGNNNGNGNSAQDNAG